MVLRQLGAVFAPLLPVKAGLCRIASVDGFFYHFISEFALIPALL